METKKCTECGQIKPISEMSKSYTNRCKACVAEHTRMVRQRAKNDETELMPKNIDWEQRRYEIATQAMIAMIDNKKINNNARLIALNAVEIANAVIRELKSVFV